MYGTGLMYPTNGSFIRSVIMVHPVLLGYSIDLSELNVKQVGKMFQS